MTADLSSQPLWLIVLSSSAISALVSAALSGFISFRARHDEYIKDYYRTVIKRRIEAYEQLEKFIINFKLSVLDPRDNRPYHLPFSNNDDTETAHRLVTSVHMQGLWLSNEVFHEVQQLNYLIFGLSEGKVIEFGRKHYVTIANLRSRLEIQMAKDMLTLHNVKTFLKSKEKDGQGFSEIRLTP